MRRHTFGMWRQWIVLAVCLAVSGWAQAQSQGDWVLARWQNGEYWFPGVVASRTADSVTVAYDDGTRETLPLSRVRPYDWKPGTPVQCRWKDGSQWYAGRISAINDDGVTLYIAYDDGDREKTRTALCRSL